MDCIIRYKKRLFLFLSNSLAFMFGEGVCFNQQGLSPFISYIFVNHFGVLVSDIFLNFV